ncbi:MAG: glycoside hydrolase family 25 protein [Betaproteobacteria bacterium]|nr:glycoside hydrolase family 25 protein [Betaproteobacteria bacterium]
MPTKSNKLKFLTITICAAALTAGLFFFGILHFNNPSIRDYPIRGIDISRYQGVIDWNVIANQGISFAFIKATEGSAHTDRYFAQNLKGALQTKLHIGAYHFFNFDSPGASQAAHFIATVPIDERMLPPVVDFEFYGDKLKNPPDREKAVQELSAMLDILAKHYGKTPVIYVTKETYDTYIAGGFAKHPIWYRDIFRSPSLSDGRAWTFWQFSNRHKIKGYIGSEKYIDFNVFNGSLEKFMAFVK